MKLCEPPSSVTLVSTSMPTKSEWGLMWRRLFGCFAVLRQLQSVQLIRLDYGNASLAEIPQCLLQRLQSVTNLAARLGFSLSRYDHVTPLLRQLHWLKTLEWIDYKVAVLVYKYLYGTAPSYLADKLCPSADIGAQRHLRSALSPSLVVRRMWLSTIVDQAFPVIAAYVWNGFLHHVTSSASSLCSAVIWRLTYFCTAFLDCFLSCLSSDSVISRHVNHSSSSSSSLLAGTEETKYDTVQATIY